MTEQSRQKHVSCAMLCLCLVFFSCDDLKCGSSLRNYDSSDRIGTITAEIAKLEKDKDRDSSTRLGDLNEQLANIYLEKENLDSALVHINKALSYGRNTPYLNYVAGLVYANRGAKSGSRDDIDKAEKYYRQAAGMHDKYDEALYALAVLLFFHKDERKEPISIMEQISARSPSNYRARFALGRFYYESDRNQDALNVYMALQEDIEKNPDSPIMREFKKNSDENIRKIRDEMGTVE